MPGRWVYDFLYRIGAARASRGWDRGVAPELSRLVEDGTLSIDRLGGRRAIDLGCGTGTNVVYLARRGFEATGVDFSGVAIRRAREAAERAGMGDRATFVVGDLSKPLAVVGPFDLIVIYNVVQDLNEAGRGGLAASTNALSRPGTSVLLWCWYGRKDDLPPISYRGPSRIAPFVVQPGEERDLFGDAFDYERLAPDLGPRKAAFLLTRRG